MSDTERRPLRTLDADVLHVYAGLVLTSLGAGLAWVPAGLMVMGAGLLAIGAASVWIRRV